MFTVKNTTGIIPKASASLVIIDIRNRQPYALMGRRHDNHAFLPGIFVFPGGGVERCDYVSEIEYPLIPEDINRLVHEKSHFTIRHAHALSLCAIRETMEETGLMVAKASKNVNIFLKKAWSPFLLKDGIPAPCQLRYFARAITPTGFIRRYDTRFFLTSRSSITNINAMTPSKELDDLLWINLLDPPEIALIDITRCILRDAIQCVKLDQSLKQPMPVTSYYNRHGKPIRKVLEV